jgi:lysozyme family protein
MDGFAEAFARTVGVEGGYSNDPLDPGGATMYGVTERVARAWGFRGSMRDLPLDVARQIYREQYWDPLRLDEVASVAPAVALEVFDSAVNLGVVPAATFLQRSLGALGLVDVTVDGHLGAVTMAGLRSYLAPRKDEGVLVLLRCLNGLQLAEYVRQVEVNPDKRRFFYGWVRARVVI